MILTSSLIAVGATRQAGSHIKACVAFGYPVDSLKAVVEAADKLAQWVGIQFPLSMNIERLAQEARKESSYRP
jgi:tRNA A37 threonylcarbamoyltransferase TsaD